MPFSTNVWITSYGHVSRSWEGWEKAHGSKPRLSVTLRLVGTERTNGAGLSLQFSFPRLKPLTVICSGFAGKSNAVVTRKATKVQGKKQLVPFKYTEGQGCPVASLAHPPHNSYEALSR